MENDFQPWPRQTAQEVIFSRKLKTYHTLPWSLIILTFPTIPTTNTHYNFRNSDKIPYFKTKHNFFKNSFFHLVIIALNKLDPSLRRYNSYKSNILKFIQSSSNSFFHCIILSDPITRMRLGFSNLGQHKFKHSFQDSLNAICNCDNDVESAIQFSSTVPYIVMNVSTLLSSLFIIDHTLLDNTNLDEEYR